MQLNTLKRIHKWKKQAPVGRGSKRGKTSGRGTKGQKARAGRKLRPEIRDVIMRLPKLRGRGTNSFVSRFVRPLVLKLEDFKALTTGQVINRESLLKAGLIKKNDSRGGLKIIGPGSIDKPFKFEGFVVTQSVKEAIEKAGGSVSN